MGIKDELTVTAVANNLEERFEKQIVDLSGLTTEELKGLEWYVEKENVVIRRNNEIAKDTGVPERKELTPAGYLTERVHDVTKALYEQYENGRIAAMYTAAHQIVKMPVDMQELLLQIPTLTADKLNEIINIVKNSK